MCQVTENQLESGFGGNGNTRGQVRYKAVGLKDCECAVTPQRNKELNA